MTQAIIFNAVPASKKTKQPPLKEGYVYSYGSGRTGLCVDISTDGLWVLLERHDVRQGEQAHVAIRQSDKDLEIVNNV